MLDWGKVRFFWGEVAQNFSRNVTLALTAIGTVAISIVVLGAFLFMRGAFDMVMKKVIGQVVVAAYLKDGVPQPAIDRLVKGIKLDPRIDDVKFISKKQALEDLRNKLRGQVDLGLINTNPLPDAIVVHAADPADVPGIASALEKHPEIGLVNYQSQLYDKMVRMEAVLSAIGLGLIAMLLVATALIIYNTVRLTVFARQREIGIMRLVGATQWTIRWPFVIEGMLAGIAGASAGIGVLWLGHHILAPKIELNLPFLPLNLANVPVGHLALELLITGAVVGTLASLLSVDRALQAAS